MRLNADGTRDNTFNAGGMGANDTVHALAVQPDGKIIIGGDFTRLLNILSQKEINLIDERRGNLSLSGTIDYQDGLGPTTDSVFFMYLAADNVRFANEPEQWRSLIEEMPASERRRNQSD
jgi:hypothetical protein